MLVIQFHVDAVCCLFGPQLVLYVHTECASLRRSSSVGEGFWKAAEGKGAAGGDYLSNFGFY